MSRQEFDASLVTLGRWTCVKMPFFAPAIFGSRARVRVWATVNGHAFHGSVFPTGDGGFFMAVGRAVRNEAKVMAGDRVHVVIEREEEPRLVDVPAELVHALDLHPTARARFERLSAHGKREIVHYVENGKGEYERTRRIERSLARLSRVPRRKTS